ncbi:class I adenylate-forming enzyme family protein [Horticoccus sp. 23ND18S-11]|uniref:class I adenylate-forming enzyme family protein n=1 Tax=Horticoccus sp. 23ND18S-11 TaxID=3391832 RepID=UPI0039C8F43C
MNPTLRSAWEDTVRAAPGATALVEPATAAVVTRAALDAAADAWRQAHGTGLADRTVVLAEPNGPEWFRVFIGLLKSGAVIVPIDPGEPAAAQEATAQRLGAVARWSGGALVPVATRSRPARDGRRLIKLTSGSTGVPRALAFTDAQMLADGRQVCAAMNIRTDDTNFGLIPFGHSYGLGNLVVPLLAQGTAIVCGTVALPHAIVETIARWRPTVFPAVPALLRALVVSDVAPGRLASLRTVISAGAPLAAEIAEAFHVKFDRKVHSFYGSSETGGITYDQSGDAARTGRSVGQPLPGVRLEWGRGRRFTVASEAVYTLGNRRRTAGGGSYQPADLATLNAAGELVLLGRSGRFVKIAGRRLNLAEVERALRAVPGVRDAFVVPHSARVDALAAAVATDLAADALRTALQERLAPWKIPKRIVTFATFPVTPRGKTDTRRLRGQLGE